MAKKEKPTIWDEVIKPNMPVIQAYIRDGMTQKEICDKFGMSPTTMRKYMDLYPEFKEMWNETKEKTDIVHVVGAYYRQATGYTVEEVEKQYKYEKGKKVLVGEKVKTRYIPPVEKATANWIAMRLKNHPEWGRFAELLYGQSDGQRGEEAGVVLIPQRINTAEEKIVEVKVREVVKNGENPVETTSEAS